MECERHSVSKDKLTSTTEQFVHFLNGLLQRRDHCTIEGEIEAVTSYSTVYARHCVISLPVDRNDRNRSKVRELRTTLTVWSGVASRAKPASTRYVATEQCAPIVRTHGQKEGRKAEPRSAGEIIPQVS